MYCCSCIMCKSKTDSEAQNKKEKLDFAAGWSSVCPPPTTAASSATGSRVSPVAARATRWGKKETDLMWNDSTRWNSHQVWVRLQLFTKTSLSSSPGPQDLWARWGLANTNTGAFERLNKFSCDLSSSGKFSSWHFHLIILWTGFSGETTKKHPCRQDFPSYKVW